MNASSTVIDDKLHWYKDAIIYELHIKAFRDSNKDGMGDFKGLIEKLDYLQELGITAIWVLPFYPSPLKDDGYDIADYYSINPRYGTLEQFKQLLDEAHKRKLKVITELVINHTSDQHPWFQRARSAPKGSAERNFYVWTDDPNKYKDVRIIFQDFEASNWTWDPVAQEYYWHRFFHHQPDLNYDNPAVQEEIFKIIDYWCAMGVDGFRLDAVPYLYEREGTNGENLPETHEYLNRLRKYIDERYPETAFLAEANMWPEDSASYFGNGDECHMNYHFPVMPRMFMAVQQEDRYPITDIFDQTPAIPETCQWAIFLRNHDELTLEMVTDEERDFMYKVYAKDPKARINLGIRHRLAPLMDNNRSRIELMNSLLFSLPGTPVIYYGDEIGMGDNFYLGDRDGVRTPMQWSQDRNAGFSEANPQQLYLPVILDPEYHYEAVNVEMQRRNTSSLFWFMKRIINMRKSFKAFSRGDMKFLPVDNSKILAFTRTYQDETILVVANLSKFAQPAEIDLRNFNGYTPVEAFSRNAFPIIKEHTPYLFTLGPHSFQWFILQNSSTKVEQVADLPELKSVEWQQLTTGNAAPAVQNVLLSFLKKSKWFKGKARKIQNLSVQDIIPLQSGVKDIFILILEVVYESSLPELYQLAVSVVTDDQAQRLSTNCPESIIALLETNDKQALLCDAFYDGELHKFFINHHQTLEEQAGTPGLTIRFKQEVADQLKPNAEIISRMHSGDNDNTSIIYDNRYLLKMYRKVERTINPDVEISNWLSENGFENVPRYLGRIEWKGEKDSLTLGMMQALIENHGDGRKYMRERLNNYIERILARNREDLDPFERHGSLTHPVAFDELSPELQLLLGSRAAEQASLIGIRTAEMHQLLASNTSKEFAPEEYSLHYQRSLFSSMQSLVRETYDRLHRTYGQLPSEVQISASSIASLREELLKSLKRIYDKKLDIWKIRIHGSFRLEKLLMTGKDLVIQNFGGNPLRSYSERRIKRSPVRDVAEMITSFNYTAYEEFFASNHISKEETINMLPFAEQWGHYMSGFFLKAYYDKVGDTPLIPNDKDELKLVLETFLLEKALAHLNFELEHRPEWALAPIRMLRSLMPVLDQQMETAR
ncbi:MAG TPA: maltose alpha-D-glucosyltransferase [Chitinophagaceae bacterium]|nr:maltose alpha-D-glucosyltransferase [Chitinophagaceae bacterium]